MPQRNTRYDKAQFANQEIRKLIVDNFIVFYKTNEKEKHVVILAIIYGRRNIDEVLSLIWIHFTLFVK